MSTPKTPVTWWDKFAQLPRFSFIKTDPYDAVTAWENKGGAWVSESAVMNLADQMSEPPTVPPEWQAGIEKALDRALVFDDGSDGADAESANSVVAILSGLLRDPRMTGREPLPAPAATGAGSSNDAAVAALQFALDEGDDPIAFLRCWLEGDFEAIRAEWPEAPEAVFIGADPLHPETKAQLEGAGPPEAPNDEMLSEGVESLRRGLERFAENYAQIACNVWEDMHHAWRGQPAPLDPTEILALWREAGGDTHGPNVETATIPLGYLPQFVEAVRGAPAPAAVPEEPIEQLEVDWEVCQTLADLPAVDAALTSFAVDPTGDNAVCLVRAVLITSPAYDEDNPAGPNPDAPWYVTNAEESLAGIAARELGDESRWDEIRDLNAARFPEMGPHDYYPVGTTLALPGVPNE